MTNYETISLDATPGGVAVILLGRPEKGNAFNYKMVEELSDALETLRTEEQLRMVILRGAGDDFCAGGDMHWAELSLDYTEKENEEESLATAEMLRRLHDLPQLTVALVQGQVNSLGAGMVAACDIAVAMEEASFCFNEVARGNIPAVMAPYVIEAIGPRWAKALFLTGESFDASYAESLGLVQYTVESEGDMEEMLEYLSTLAFANSPAAVAETKGLIGDLAGREISKETSNLVAKRSAAYRRVPDCHEGIRATLEGRKPDWME